MSGGARRILLLGAGGQVGRVLSETLADAGALTALARHDLDITDARRVGDTVRDTAPDLIVNAAAYTDVDRAEHEPDRAWAVNATAAATLARAATAAGAALLHYSTDYVFDGTADTPWTEDATPRPLGVYGRSKLGGEQAVRTAGAGHLIVRTSWVYGHGGRNFVETMLRLGAERARLAVVDDQFGAPTSARVVAEATAGIVAACARDLRAGFRGAGGVVHVTCGGSTSWHGFATEIFRQARRRGMTLRVEAVDAIGSTEYAAPAPRPRNSRLDGSRLIERFGIRPLHWKRALEGYLAERDEAG